MHELTELIRRDMLPALGVTEPGAIAFSVAKARSYTTGDLLHIHVAMNSGMYKNAFTCGIPNSTEVGNVFAAALGYVAGDAARGLESLAAATPEDNLAAKSLVDEGKVTVEMRGISSRIFIEASVKTTAGEATVTIRDSHTHITKVTVNGETLLETEREQAGDGPDAQETQVHRIHRYTLKEILDYVNTVPLEEIEFVKEAYRVNLALFEKGLNSPRTTFARQLLAMNGIHIDKVHGINGMTPEDTMRNMGLIASPGMVGTEKTILEIFEGKLK